MKTKIILAIALFVFSLNQIQAQQTNLSSIDNKTALIIIDVQLFYFPGGAVELSEPEIASANSKKILQTFREKNGLVIHIRHNSNSQGEIHDDVKPIVGEKIISKDEANSFNGTDLLNFLKENKIENLVICGMQTHMCVEAATRAAYDLGFKCTLIGDACATRDLKYGDSIIKAEEVHNSTLSSLKGGYANVINTEEFLKKLD